MTNSQTHTPLLVTVLAIAHIFAIVALIGLVLFSSILEEMGRGSTGVIITSLTFITLVVNAVLLFQARREILVNNSARAKHLLYTAGGIFLAYNLIATLLNSAFLQNLLVSIVVLAIAFWGISRLDQQKQAHD